MMYGNALAALKRVRPLLIAGVLALPVMSQAQALAEPVGYIMKVQGEATVTSRGQTIDARAGQAVVLGAILRTGAQGSMGVTLSDNTVMSFGPNSEFTLDEYQFEPAREELRLSARISRGTLNFISGVIAKLKPEAVELKTPTGTIGVRGTHFLVKVGE
ncbi:FecR domain-containing protein [Pseudomonas stutzeri]|uniref:FecR family protein n=1 Tax=Stutzerimonas stutzeri TaxID=316 RepID=UPI00210ACD26|nr:FecR family protein [Stutzerimonas stutzeri]MCQ4312430.1 FecR domain-containing protein [Stutzerimonas stutzeri]